MVYNKLVPTYLTPEESEDPCDTCLADLRKHMSDPINKETNDKLSAIVDQIKDLLNEGHDVIDTWFRETGDGSCWQEPLRSTMKEFEKIAPRGTDYYHDETGKRVWYDV